jgi:hypothetical protein
VVKKNEETTALATATAADFGGGLAVKGKSDSGSNLSRLIMFQGTAEEEKMYGGHKRGIFMDALEIRELGDTVRIMPVFAFAQWSIWPDGAKQPTQVWHDEKDVPPELLEWKGEGTDREPPEAQEQINVVCCVEGEPWPYTLIFKRTSLRAFQRTIAPLEARRGAMNKCPGLYELTSEDDKNGDGQTFKRLKARPVGDPPTELVTIAKAVFAAQQAFKAKAVEMVKDEAPVGGFDPAKV